MIAVIKNNIYFYGIVFAVSYKLFKPQKNSLIFLKSHGNREYTLSFKTQALCILFQPQLQY